MRNIEGRTTMTNALKKLGLGGVLITIIVILSVAAPCVRIVVA